MLLLYQQLKPSMLQLKPWIIMGGGVGSQILIGILAIIACLSIARRPAVFWNGQVVDGQDTVSVIQRYVLFWTRRTFLTLIAPGTLLLGPGPFSPGLVAACKWNLRIYQLLVLQQEQRIFSTALSQLKMQNVNACGELCFERTGQRFRGLL